MMMNMKTVRYTDESRESPNEPDGLIKRWRFNGYNSATEIGRQQSGSIGSGSGTYCCFLKNLMEP